MKKPARREPLIFDERRRRWRGGQRYDRVVEYVHYPSRRALDLWEYVVWLGTSRIAKGRQFSHGGGTRGYVMHYVRRGELRHVVRGKPYLARSGDVCLMEQGRSHAQFQEHRGMTSLWWVLFDGRNMERIFAELRADTDPLIVNVDRRRFEALFHELWLLVTKPPVAQEARMNAVLHAMLAELFAARDTRLETPNLIAQKSALSEKVRSAVHVIEQHFEQNLGLKQMQSLVGMDMYNLAKRFRKEIGMPPIQYLNRYRMEIAKRMLATTDRPVFDIARRVGFSDPDYFTRAFRKIVSESPQAYRQRTRAVDRAAKKDPHESANAPRKSLRRPR